MESTAYEDRHICLIYTYPAEQIITTWKFFEEGFNLEERCIYITDGECVEKLTGEIKNNGKNPKDYLNSRKLIILDNQETYLKKGTLDASSMQQLIEEAKKQAITDGFTGIRISGELPIVDGIPIDKDVINKYESEIDDYLSNCNGVKALCNYNKNIHNTKTLTGLLNFHARVKIYGKTYKNEFYRTNTMEPYINIIDKLIEDEGVN